VRPLGLPLDLPPHIISRALSDLGSLARIARNAPATLERTLDLGDQILAMGRDMLAIAERLDARVEAVLAMGARIEDGATELVELGIRMEQLGARVNSRGEEIVDRAAEVVQRAGELIAVLPALERALELATPLEGAIDRFGRLVDRLPGAAQRRPGAGPGTR
jgi:hypothetical protein